MRSAMPVDDVLTCPSSAPCLPQVIPFLALAVGVDNMFVLAHALQRQVGGWALCDSPMYL
jgi:hypothetical protein